MAFALRRQTRLARGRAFGFRIRIDTCRKPTCTDHHCHHAHMLHPTTIDNEERAITGQSTHEIRPHRRISMHHGARALVNTRTQPRLHPESVR